jgi:serine/threonine protein kinase
MLKMIKYLLFLKKKTKMLCIGEGLSGKVYLEGKYAIKIFKSKHSFEKEEGIYLELKNVTNIVSLISSCKEKKEIVMEYIPNQLEKYIVDRKITHDKKIFIIDELFIFLTSIHSMGYIHGDFKAKNILVDDDIKKVKVADFDLSKKSNDYHIDYCKFRFIIIQLYFEIDYETSWKNYNYLVSKMNDNDFIRILKIVEQICKK